MSCVHTASHPERGLARPRLARVQGREPPSRSGGPSANRTLRNEPSESRGREGRREANAASGRAEVSGAGWRVALIGRAAGSAQPFCYSRW